MEREGRKGKGNGKRKGLLFLRKRLKGKGKKNNLGGDRALFLFFS